MKYRKLTREISKILPLDIIPIRLEALRVTFFDEIEKGELIYEKWDQNLAYYSEVIETQLGIAIANIPGTGAAGGLGAGFIAFLNAEIKPGFELISEIVHLAEQIVNADLVITAEGKIDYQTRFGKTPAGVTGIAKNFNKPLLAFAGSLWPRVESLNELGFTSIIPITDKPMSLQESITNAGELLMNAAERTMRILKLDYWGLFEK